MRRNVMFVVAFGLAMLGSSIARSDDADQAALIKALGDAKLTLLQGIAQVAKGTEVPIEAKYQMVHGKLMLSIYTSAKGFDTAAEDNSFNEYIGDVTTATWTPEKDVFADLKHIARSAQYHALLSMSKVRRGRPRPATGQIICTLPGYTLRCRATKTRPPAGNHKAAEIGLGRGFVLGRRILPMQESIH
jgi:hypothetical protein